MAAGRFFLLPFSILAIAHFSDATNSVLLAQGVPTDVIENYPTVRAPPPAAAPSPADAPPPVIIDIPTAKRPRGEAKPAPLTADELKRLHDNQVQMTPPAPPSAKSTPSLAPQYHGSNTFVSPPPATPSQPARVGGISLTKAAAERMPLNLSIEGAFVKDGRIVLAGHRSTDGSIDAALFLTALRATCEGRDPYFSLDPDDVSLWLKETEKGGEEFFEHVKKDATWALQKRATRNSQSILNFRTISASQSYPAYWSSILAKYPHLKSRLVFGPEWLRQTRFGEILYKADVLLKELAGGVSMLGAPQLRASKIDDYLSATRILSARRLLYKYHNLPEGKSTVAGGRIWYDLSETSDVAAERPESIPIVSSELRTLLQQRHLLPDSSTFSILPASLKQNESALDISGVFPRMYVRVRDPITLRDGAGNFPGVNELAAEANASPQKYAAAYKEYRALVEVFRAYVVAVHTRKMQPKVCIELPIELLDAERLSVALPEYQPTDLALTIGWYEYSEDRVRRAIGATGALFQGGVSVGATALYNRIAEYGPETPVLRELKAETAKIHSDPTWAGDSGWQFVAFTFDAPQPAALVFPAPLPSGDVTLPSGEVAKSVQLARLANAISKGGEEFEPPVRPPTPRPAVGLKERKSNEQQSTQWEQRQGDKTVEGFPDISSVSAGPRRAVKLEEFLIPFAITLVFLFILHRLVKGFSPARTTSSASQGKTPQGSFAFAMPDLSSPDSIPYVPPWQKDLNWKTRAVQTANSSSPQGDVQPDLEPPSYEAVERDFKNVFAMKSQVDKEQLIRHWRNIHGGSREDAMRRLVEQWRHDNRSWS